MRAVELFTGAGGLALGMSSAGFEHLALIERDPDSCATMRSNQVRGVKPITDWPIFEQDVRAFDYAGIPAPIDLVAGGPPCQPFSLGGKHKGYQDRRDMFPEAVRAVRELRPRAFVFENVKGLLRQGFALYFQYTLLKLQYPEEAKDEGEDWESHSRRLQRIHTKGGYDGLRYRVLFSLVNAADYGVPQKRERVIIVGFRSDLRQKWSFPLPTHSRDALLHEMYVSGVYWDRHEVPRNKRPAPPANLQRQIEELKSDSPFFLGKPWRTVRDALHGLPNPESASTKDIPNHKLVHGARRYPGHTGSPWDEPAKTLKAGDHGVPGGENMLLKADGSVRYFTIRESARLQTFPDDYYFPGSWTESMRQLGNAVPVTLASVVGQSVARSLLGTQSN